MKTKCPPEESALKSFFLGPQSENSEWVQNQINEILNHWFQWRKGLYPTDGRAISRFDQGTTAFRRNQKQVEEALKNLCRRFEGEIPQFSPRYIGHMFSEISLPALLGHFTALLHNPNNISTEAARVGAHIETEAISELAKMLGFNPKKATGHFTSGGTVANIESLWRARYRMDHFLSLACYLNEKHQLGLSYVEAGQMGWTRFEQLIKKYRVRESDLRNYSPIAANPWQLADRFHKAFGHPYHGPVVLVPNSKHYSWMKAVSLLGLGEESFWPVLLDQDGILDLKDLKIKIQQAHRADRPVLMIVSVAGTTELGECDPVHHVQDLLDRYQEKMGLSFWHHVDAAYGGYFCSMITKGKIPEFDKTMSDAFFGIRRVNSVTLDPHKLGYVPFSCGALLVRDQVNNRVSAFDAKYILSPNLAVDRWMKTLEGSRGAAGATATWMTAKTIGLQRSGYGSILKRTVITRQTLTQEIRRKCPHIRIIDIPSSNLLTFSVVGRAKDLKSVNMQTEDLIAHFLKQPDFFISKTFLRSPEYAKLIQAHCQKWNLKENAEGISLMRMTLMNPFFLNQESIVNYLELLIETLNRRSEVALL